MIAVTAYPIGYAVYLSLQRYNLAFPNLVKFVGLSNYAAVLTSPYWWHALEVTAGHHGHLGGHRARARHAAGAAHAPDAVRPRHRPHRRPHPVRDRDRRRRLQLAVRLDAGHRVPVRALPQQRAAHGARLAQAIGTIILAEVWKTTPFMALLLLAGLALVPEDLQKAAKVDGATAWQRFTRITLPLMKPAILVALLFRTLDAFRIFDNIYILTAGRQRHRTRCRSSGTTTSSTR